ncbi:MAG: hypothetical protein IPP29_14175 [Bacteroidetes bacterium]|nr:hypothetical protein [Bacteroidota bacterium]MBL0052566.1 hypothetical protein [Bacteroidota bacterium]
MKKIILILSIATITGLQSCAPGYSVQQPIYAEGARPATPGATHVWVDGDWRWNYRQHKYAYRNGYWARPYRGRTFHSGSWKHGPRGYRWIKGTWR